MSAQDEDQDKSFDPTPQKLLEARRKGEVAKSVDLQTAAGYAGLTLALLAAGAQSVQSFGAQMMAMIAQADDIATLIFEGGPTAPLGGWMIGVAHALLPVFVLPAVAVLVAILAQKAFVVAPSKLQPKLSRISILQNAKQKFGRGGLFEFAKSFSKLLIYSACLAVFLKLRLPDMIAVIRNEPGGVALLLAELFITFMLVVVVISGAIGAIDGIWQYHEHIRKNRMSRKEVMDETKNSEGDPHLKQERRSRAQAIATQQMMADVPKADVIIVNPTHFAVALKWERAPGKAPMCVAKGVDEVARRIREIAIEASVPIHHDPPTARALHAVTEIGSEILPEHYHAVAAAIRFADQIRDRARRGA